MRQSRLCGVQKEVASFVNLCVKCLCKFVYFAALLVRNAVIWCNQMTQWSLSMRVLVSFNLALAISIVHIIIARIIIMPMKKNIQSNPENEIYESNIGWESDLMLAQMRWGNFKEMLTHDKPWVFVCCVCDPTRTCTVWVTHLLSCYVTDVFFIFSTDRVSSPGFVEQQCTETQLPVCWCSLLSRLHMKHTWFSVLNCSQRGVTCRKEAHGATRRRMPGKPMAILKLQSHCDAVPSIWKDTDAANWGLKLASTCKFTPAKCVQILNIHVVNTADYLKKKYLKCYIIILWGLEINWY